MSNQSYHLDWCYDVWEFLRKAKCFPFISTLLRNLIELWCKVELEVLRFENNIYSAKCKIKIEKFMYFWNNFAATLWLSNYFVTTQYLFSMPNSIAEAGDRKQSVAWLKGLAPCLTSMMSNSNSIYFTFHYFVALNKLLL